MLHVLWQFLFVVCVFGAKQFNLFGDFNIGIEGGNQDGKGNGKGTGPDQGSEAEGSGVGANSQAIAQREKQVNKLVADLRDFQPTLPAGAGAVSGTGGDFGSATGDAGKAARSVASELAEHLEKAVFVKKNKPVKPLDFATLFARVAQALNRVPGDRLLRQEGELRRCAAISGLDQEMELEEGKPLTISGFLVRTEKGILLVSSLWRIRQGLYPRPEDFFLVKLEPSIAEIPELQYRPVVVAGRFFSPGDPGVNAGLDARKGKGEVTILEDYLKR